MFSQVMDSSALPSFQAPAAAGSLVLIFYKNSCQIQPSIAWTGLSGYNNYIIYFNNVVTVTSGDALTLQVGTSGGLITSGYTGRLSVYTQ